MTRKEKQKAIDVLKISVPVRPMTHEEFNDYIQTLNKIMDWLEQEPILDRIRAEIKSKIVKRPWLDFEDRERDRNDAFLEVLDIIDKYKAELEV